MPRGQQPLRVNARQEGVAEPAAQRSECECLKRASETELCCSGALVGRDRSRYHQNHMEGERLTMSVYNPSPVARKRAACPARGIAAVLQVATELESTGLLEQASARAR